MQAVSLCGGRKHHTARDKKKSLFGVAFFIFGTIVAVFVVSIKTQKTMAHRNETAPIHHCNVCGRTMYWKDFIWVNSNFGVCEDCHKKIPQDINEEIQEENYNEKVVKFLNEMGASF